MGPPSRDSAFNITDWFFIKGPNSFLEWLAKTWINDDPP